MQIWYSDCIPISWPRRGPCFSMVHCHLLKERLFHPVELWDWYYCVTSLAWYWAKSINYITQSKQSHETGELWVHRDTNRKGSCTALFLVPFQLFQTALSKSQALRKPRVPKQAVTTSENQPGPHTVHTLHLHHHQYMIHTPGSELCHSFHTKFWYFINWQACLVCM